MLKLLFLLLLALTFATILALYPSFPPSSQKAGAKSPLLLIANSSAILISPKEAQQVGYFKYSSKLVGGGVCVE